MVWLTVIAGFLIGAAAEGVFGMFWGAILGFVFGHLLKTQIQALVRQELQQRGWTPPTPDDATHAARPSAPPARPALPTAPPAAPDPSAPFAPPGATVPAEQPAPAVAAASTAAPARSTAPTPTAARPASPPRKAPAPDPVTQWGSQALQWLMGGNTVLRLGLLMLFAGLAFLAKYSIDHALLPPELRLAGIGLAALVLFALGWRKRNTPGQGTFSLSLQGAGVGVLYLTIFAALRLYHLLPAGAAFGLLALVCALSTAIALLQNAQTMAFIGFAGAFAAPVLASTGQGDHVGLFSYYLLLNCGIVAIAALRAWRPLNLLGFFATFGIATAWGVLQYRPEHLDSTLPFLGAFFAQYLLAAWWYALRHGLPQQRAVDATLVFGNPVVSMGLLAHMVWDIPYASAAAALGLAAWYLLVATWTLKRYPSPTGRWLLECCVALTLGFATLAVPLALDGRWLSAAWAAEGAAVYWIGVRQQRWLARFTGCALQALAALVYLQTGFDAPNAGWLLADERFVSALLLAASALAIAWMAHLRGAPQDPKTAWNEAFLALESLLPQGFFLLGFVWWQCALWTQIDRLEAIGASAVLAGVPGSLHLVLLAWVGSAWAAHFLALPGRAKPLPAARYPAALSLPWMLGVALVTLPELGHGFESGGWWVWPLALVWHLHTLRHIDTSAPQAWWSWTHSAGAWLLMLLAGKLLYWAVDQAQLWHSAWATVVLLSAAWAVLLALGAPALYQPQGRWRQRWPLAGHASAYLWRAAAPLALLVLVGALLVAWRSSGNAAPLPYIPLINPTDLSVALGLLACAHWMQRLRASALLFPSWALHKAWPTAWAAVVFIALNTVWLRMAHHFGGVAWTAPALYDSFLVQAGYSLLWTLLALGLMLSAHRRQQRGLWSVGAALLALTVLKLLLIDLSNRGGAERIVTFIGVGVLMLVIGYFAPIPPAAQDPQKARA
ncbi:MAG: DUF2339 domain-containing protein [Rhodoferax sp.]